jgi:DNA-binding response OmpR family regulator
MRLLVIEDDLQIAALIRTVLEAARFEVAVCTNGVAGLREAASRPYNLIVLDVMLPGQDGWTISRTLRARRETTPILMVTARDSIDDRVTGFEVGADDYLCKPFDAQELVARVRGLLRRDRVHRIRVIRIADLTLDTGSGRVWRAGEEIQLTPREYTLLEALAANEGRILTREKIVDQVWMDEESCSNTVDVHIMSLRRKIDAAHPLKLIETAYGKGYMLRVPEAAEAAR